MARSRSVILAALAAVVVACASPVAPSTPPSGSPSGSVPGPLDRIPVANTVERDGITMTIQLDARQVTAGDKVRLLATVTNTEPGIVMWQGGGCDLLGNLLLRGPDVPAVPLRDPPPGQHPAAITGLIRWAALATLGPGHTMFTPPNLPPGAAFGCTADLRINELRPGETERIEAVWSGTMSDGLPAPAGAYSVRISFPFLTRQAAPPFEGDPLADARPILLEVPFEVVGAPWQGLTAVEALDIALADPRVQAWIAGGLERTAVGGARIALADGVWRLEVDISGPTGDTAGIAIVEVDPTSGDVLRVALPAS